MSQTERIVALPTGAWLRLAGLVAVLLAVILVPFALWGAALDGAAPEWLQVQDARLVIALLGIALLIADVLLPVPGSVIAVALCWTLGPLVGAICVTVGYLLAFVFGYALGRLAPEARLRAWIGAALWDRMRAHAGRRALWWIAIARPMPVLSEISALMAGVLRVPLRLALPCAFAASLAVGALYGISVQLAGREPGLATMLLAMFALPCLLWLAQRVFLHRLMPGGTAPSTRVPPPPTEYSQ